MTIEGILVGMVSGEPFGECRTSKASNTFGRQRKLVFFKRSTASLSRIVPRPAARPRIPSVPVTAKHAPRNIHAGTVINEQELSPYSSRKLDRSSFAIVQVQKCRVVNVASSRHDLDPRRWFLDPAAYTLRSLIVPQLIPHDLWHKYLLKQDG
jgi:hypothetical protein